MRAVTCIIRTYFIYMYICKKKKKNKISQITIESGRILNTEYGARLDDICVAQDSLVVKYFRKYILCTFPPILRIVLIRLYLLGVYLIVSHTHVIIEGCEKSRDRGSLLACRSDLASCKLARRKTSFRIPGVLTYASVSRYDIGRDMLSLARARRLEEIYLCLRSVRAILRRGGRARRKFDEKYARQW